MPKTNAQHDIDLDGFPPGAVTRFSKLLCLACLFKLFTKQMGLAARTAYSEIKRHEFSISELTGKETTRPFFQSDEKHPRCPYCNAAKRWHAHLEIYRIEGGKATDAARRALVKSLPKLNENFQLIEQKTTGRAAFFAWLDTLGGTLDFADDGWLLQATQAFLERREPKTKWGEIFAGVRAARRSQRLSVGWERDGARLFLAPSLYAEALLVQYLVSRSQAHGGLTLEGRLTLIELFRRLRQAGLFASLELTGADQAETLEKLIDQVTGGDISLKLHFLVDRRDFLAKAKAVYTSLAS
ncbi:MAG: hypothetical protein ACR2GW_12585 [Pyrinomonadaceae bacterium]|nr:hypothetical protein [Pyrinomonadaceae bacterium]